ncbi:HNH endonuclease family protein [Amnibacterium kyonggiense]|nr:HNH endonuclease family protein [Amnibacterium kyonggiense]
MVTGLALGMGAALAVAAFLAAPRAGVERAVPAPANPAVPAAAIATESPRSTASPQPPAQVADGATALTLLGELQVRGRAPMTGYERTNDFGAAWLDADRNGCDTRNDILRRDLADPSGTRCNVRSGVLRAPYTGETIRFQRGLEHKRAVQVDHVVSLGDAWRTGAQQLSLAQRIRLANDPLSLLAVDGPTNQDKRDKDAATWLPPNRSFRCEYVARQVAVKHAYGLWVTPVEKAAMSRVLTIRPLVVAPSANLH